ncbi:MAG: class A beta-lactamase [Gammaproteobacteria bacterium]|nr:class A beta-lactamase [Gammaproteobacteria bacterium]
MKSSWIKYFLLTLAILSGGYYAILFANTRNNESRQINKKFETLETSLDGRIGVYAINTANNQSIQYRAVERFPIQSTFKIMAISAILKQSATNPHILKQKMTYTTQDLVYWSPITEKHVAEGMTISELCAATMMYRDNTATNLIIKKLGGPGAVNAYARSINDETFRIDSLEPNLNSDPMQLRDTSTPTAMENSLQKIILGNVLPSFQQKQLITWMKGNTTGDARIRAGVPKGWIVADKTGASNEYGISNDIGIIWPPNCAPIVVVIYSVHHTKDASRRDDILAAATRIIIDGFTKTDSRLKEG